MAETFFFSQDARVASDDEDGTENFVSLVKVFFSRKDHLK